jgi:hypothetical protein
MTIYQVNVYGSRFYFKNPPTIEDFKKEVDRSEAERIKEEESDIGSSDYIKDIKEVYNSIRENFDYYVSVNGNDIYTEEHVVEN